MAITLDWQVEYNGLLMGAETPYKVASYEGLVDMPDVRTSDHARLRRHGYLAGDSFLGGRSVVMTFAVLGDSTSEFSAAVEALKLALMPCEEEAPLYFQIPGIAGTGIKFLNARPRKLNSSANRLWAVMAPTVMVEFFATDPRIYTEQDTQFTGMAVAGGGATFNATFDWAFGTAGGGGSMEVTNQGTFPTPVQFRIDGPVTDPIITNVTQDKALAFEIVLAAGEYLEIDTDARTILLNGTGSRYSALLNTSDWFDLTPGTNEISFSASAPTAATLTAFWKSAWV